MAYLKSILYVALIVAISIIALALIQQGQGWLAIILAVVVGFLAAHILG